MFVNTLLTPSLTALNLLAQNGQESVQAIDVAPAQPPGMENMTTVISWILWGGGMILFVFFIFGIVQAGRARRGGNEVEAPIWPLVAACILGASGVIWTTLTGA